MTPWSQVSVGPRPRFEVLDGCAEPRRSRPRPDAEVGWDDESSVRMIAEEASLHRCQAEARSGGRRPQTIVGRC